MKIMIVDQCEPFRQEMIRLLRYEPDLEIVGDGKIGSEMVEQTSLYRPDIVLMGSDLFEAGGRELMNVILSEYPETAFIILAPADNLELLLESLRNGARGYLPKNISEAALMRSLYAVERGELAVSRSMMATVVSELRKILQVILASENNSLSTLTGRDVQIIRLLATEGSNQEIARHLLISDRTASRHLHSLPREARHQRETADFARRARVNGKGHITD